MNGSFDAAIAALPPDSSALRVAASPIFVPATSSAARSFGDFPARICTDQWVVLAELLLP